MTEVYFHVYSATMNPCCMVKGVLEEAQRTWFCSGCCCPRPGFREIDAVIQEKRPEPVLNGVAACGLGLAHIDFLAALGQDVVERDLHIGRVFDRNGDIINDWVTFRGRRKLIVRGRDHVGYRKCDQCGRSVYFAMGDPYLCPPPKRDDCVYESDLWGLVIPERLMGRIMTREWKGVHIQKLAVLAEPQDGLPIELDP